MPKRKRGPIKGGEVTSSSSSDEESDEEQIAISIDQHGRVVFGGKLNYEFQCFENIFSCCANDKSFYPSMFGDCKGAFTAREMENDADYSSGDTFFLPASAERPKSRLEQIVKDIFDYHTKDVSYDPKISGAEWWTLVVDSSDGGVGFHWDKDYGMEEHGVSIFPHIATVTYISQVEKAAPTIVLEKTSPPIFEASVEGKAGKNVYISWPKQGKHIAFDGRYLHAACTELIPAPISDVDSRSKETSVEKRISLLVNIWLNHVPKDAVTCPKSISRKFCQSNVGRGNTLNFEDCRAPTDLKVTRDKSFQGFGLKDFEWQLFVDSVEHTVCASIPISKIEDARAKDKDTNLCRLVYDDSVSLPRVVKKHQSVN